MLSDKKINPSSKSQQDYFLLGVCIANTLLLLTFIRRIVPNYFKPTVDPNIFGGSSPDIDIPLYVISWIFIFISFVAYYFLNNYLSKCLDVEIKSLISKGLLFLSLTALLGVHALYLVKALSGAGNSMEIDINILIFGYLAIAVSLIVLCLFRRFRFLQLFNRFIQGSNMVFLGGASFLLIRSIYSHFISVFPYQHIRAYLLAESQLQTTNYSPAEILLTILFILLFTGLLILSKSKLSFKNRLFILLVDMAVVSAIIFTVFNIYYDGPNGGDYYVGPINDILHGKTLLVDVPSQYGLLSIYAIALLFKGFGIPLTYGNFALLNTIMYIAGYTLTYVILRVWLKNILIPIFGIFLVILQNYFVQIGNPMICPQVGFLRFGWWIPVMVLVMIRTRLDTGERDYQRYILRGVELLLVAIAFFWIADAGSFVLGAYIVSIFVSVFNNQSKIRPKIKTFLLRMAEIIAALLLMFALISIFTFMGSHHWPTWYGFVQVSLIYAVGGLGMDPMPETGLYLLFVAVYLLSVSYIIVKLFFSAGKTERDLPIISFITAFGIMQFIYYVGRSHPNNLHNVVIPLIMVICWFMLKGSNFALSKNGRDFLRRNVLVASSLSLLIILLIALPLLLSTKQMILQVSNRGNIIELLNSRDNISWLTSDKNEQSNFRKSVIAIEENEKGQEKVALISVYDTYFLVETGKTNIMNSNNLNPLIYTFQYEELASQLLEAKPANIYMDHRATHPSMQLMKDTVLTNYFFVENVGELDRFVERREFKNKE